ncbi:MAG: hypothetical protein ABI113_20750 [Mucilaginibacter sp.]
MKIFYTFFSLVFLLPFFSSAQSNYKPGYVVNLKGDTLRGFIDYHEWNSNPGSFYFRKVLSEKPQKYTSDEVQYFSVDGLAAYKRYAGPISTDVVNTDHLTTGKDTSFRLGVVFLKVLQKGKNITLYSYSDDFKTRYFVADAPDFNPAELIYHIYEGNDGNGIAKTFVDETYLKQLNMLAIKYNMLSDDLAHLLQKADYQRPSLMLITSKINNISNEDFKKRYGDNIACYLYGGIAANFVTTSPANHSVYQQAGGKSSSSILPAAKFGINLFANPNTQRLSFRFEFVFALAKYNSVYNNAFFPYVNITYGYTSLAVVLSPQIVYNFYQTRLIKIYAGAGVDLTKYTYFNKQYKNNADGTTVPSATNPFGFVSFNMPIAAKAGAIINEKIDVYADYLFAGHLFDDYGFRLNANTLRIGINYKFGQ